MAEGAPGLGVLMDVAEMGILLLVVKEGLGEKEGHLSVRGMRLHKLLDRQPAEAGGSSQWWGMEDLGVLMGCSGKVDAGVRGALAL